MVRVWEKIAADSGAASDEKKKDKKSDKERLMKFEGLVLARKHGNEIGATFTVRSTILGVGLEKVYPIHAPTIEKVEILNTPKKISRSKLYYIRDISRKETRKKMATAKETVSE